MANLFGMLLLLEWVKLLLQTPGVMPGGFFSFFIEIFTSGVGFSRWGVFAGWRFGAGLGDFVITAAIFKKLICGCRTVLSRDGRRHVIKGGWGCGGVGKRPENRVRLPRFGAKYGSFGVHPDNGYCRWGFPSAYLN